MNIRPKLGYLLIFSVLTSCKDKDANEARTINAWNEVAEARLSEQVVSSNESSPSSTTAVFSDPLDGALGPHLSITGGSGTIAFDTQGTLLAGVHNGGDDGRVYIGTNASDYISSTNVGFIAEISITINRGDTNADTAFFGVGEGFDLDTRGKGPSFDEPSGGTATAYFGVRDRPLVIVNDNFLSKKGKNIAPSNGTTGPGTHRFRLTYDGTHLTLSAQINEAGPFIEHRSINVSDNGFNETNSRIFFGGSNEAVFDNFEVIKITKAP